MSSRDLRTGLSVLLAVRLLPIVGDAELLVVVVVAVVAALEDVVAGVGFTFSSSSVSVSDSSLVVSSSLLDSGSLAFDLSPAALVAVGLDWWLGKNRL